MEDHALASTLAVKPAAYATDAGEAPVSRVVQTHEKYERLIAQAKGIAAIPTAVVWPCEEHALAGPIEAAQEKIIAPILVGQAKRMRAVAEKAGLDIGGVSTVDVATEEEAASTAVRLVRDGKAQSLMKGSLHTDVLMHEVVAKEGGLRTARRISHVFVLDVPTYPDALFVTDAAINIFPDLETKRDIVQNAIDLHVALGLGAPRVAILSAVEVINPKIPGTTDAASLCKMAERGQITGGILDGPLAMDNAIDAEAAAIKGIHSPVAGHAQILVVPDLEAGNMLAKNMIFLGQADAAGIVLGAAVPIILTSRADSVRTRMASTAIGALYAYHLAEQRGQAGSHA
jgi:phosphate acetyltransferase